MGDSAVLEAHLYGLFPDCAARGFAVRLVVLEEFFPSWKSFRTFAASELIFKRRRCCTRFRRLHRNLLQQSFFCRDEVVQSFMFDANVIAVALLVRPVAGNAPSESGKDCLVFATAAAEIKLFSR